MVKITPESSLKPIKGSRAPGIGYLYIVLILFLAITAGTLLSGGFIPIDPNGPAGPPTLPFYYGINGEDEQKIIWDAKATPHYDKELQLLTFSVNTCSSTSVIDFLIDTSGSMQDDNKIFVLRDGLKKVIAKLPPSAVVGIQTFSAVVQERVPLDYLKNNRALINDIVNGLSAAGWTRTKDGLQLAATKLSDAIQKNRFPGYKYYLVILTDGVPETPPPRTCMNPPGPVPDALWGKDGRCFTEEQDPRKPSLLTQALKSAGVDVYSVAIFSKTAKSDKVMQPYLEKLLKEVSSSPPESHYFGTDFDTVNIQEVLKKITSTFCDVNIGGQVSPKPTDSTWIYPFITYPNQITNAPFPSPGGKFAPLDNPNAPVASPVPTTR